MSDTALDNALDELDGPGTVHIDRDHGSAEVDVTDAGPIGVRIREVRVARDVPCDIVEEANALPDRLRALPDPVHPVEIAPTLGGATLRSLPTAAPRQEYFEVDVAPIGTTIRRTRVDADGTRRSAEWAMTREQLERLIDEATPSSGQPPIDTNV